MADFLSEHPQWQHTPSGGDLQALVLPQLASGSRLGVGSYGCVYRPRRIWHFPPRGIAVKAVPLRSHEAAQGAAQEAALLRRVADAAGAHPNVVTLHGSFIVGEHARLALDLAAGNRLPAIRSPCAHARTRDEWPSARAAASAFT